MLSKDTNRLGWGYNAGLPEKFIAAWGCRAIFNGGRADILGDRQDFLGEDADRQRLIDRLNGGAGEAWMAAVKNRVPGLRPNEDEEFVAYSKDGLVVKVNTRASYGYLHVVAYLDVTIGEDGPR